jgi:hypothetical protein
MKKREQQNFRGRVFVDENDTHCTLTDDGDAIEFGGDTKMRLSQDMVRAVIPALKFFVKNGKLPVGPQPEYCLTIKHMCTVLNRTERQIWRYVSEPRLPFARKTTDYDPTGKAHHYRTDDVIPRLQQRMRRNLTQNEIDSLSVIA